MRSALAVIAMVALATGGACGGDEEAEESFIEREGRVLTEIVFRAYQEGRLGTQAEVQADMEPYFSPPDLDYDIPTPFDENGDLIPFSEMTAEQAAAFSLWHGESEKVIDILGPEKTDAIRSLQEQDDE